MDCEKVFLDYGVQWEEAWREHVENWDPPIDDDYTPIKEMKNLDFFRTIEELEDQPYPSNIVTSCNYWLEDGEVYDEENEDTYTAEDWIGDGSEIAAASEENYDSSIIYWPCSVLSRERSEDGTYIYEVEIFQSLSDGQERADWYVNGHRRILSNYTNAAIKFMTKEYASDQHLPGVFRSYLRIPDNLFPKQWKDYE